MFRKITFWIILSLILSGVGWGESIIYWPPVPRNFSHQPHNTPVLATDTVPVNNAAGVLKFSTAADLATYILGGTAASATLWGPYASIAGPTSAHTYTFPDASATMLYDGKTSGALGTASSVTGQLLLYNGTNAYKAILQSGAISGAADLAFTLPVANPGGNNYLVNCSTTGVLGYTNPATFAAVGQAMYIGSTAVAINRASAPLVLTGITSIDGNAASSTNAAITDDISTTATMYPTWVTANTGNLPLKVTSTKYSFNPSTGIIRASGINVDRGTTPISPSSWLQANRTNLIFTQETVPGAPTAAVSTTAGVVTAGTHKVAITLLTLKPDGTYNETAIGTSSATVTAADSVHGIDVSAIPIGTAGFVVARNVYMSKAGTTTPLYLVSNGSPTINDNSTTTYFINVADATLGTGNYIASPSQNLTGGAIYLGSSAWLLPSANASGLSIGTPITYNNYLNITTGYAAGGGTLIDKSTSTARVAPDTFTSLQLGNTNVTRATIMGGGLTVPAVMATTVTLSAATSTVVSNTAVTASTLVFIQPQTAIGAALLPVQDPANNIVGTSYRIDHSMAAGTEKVSVLVLN